MSTPLHQELSQLLGERFTTAEHEREQHGLYKNLEDLVSQRTAELEKTNLVLQAEVAERKKIEEVSYDYNKLAKMNVNEFVELFIAQ